MLKKKKRTNERGTNISLQDLWGNKPKKLSVCAQREADLLYTHFLHPCKHTSLFNEAQTHQQDGRNFFFFESSSSLSFIKTYIFLLFPLLWRCLLILLMSVIPALLYVLSLQLGPGPRAVTRPLSSQLENFFSYQILLNVECCCRSFSCNRKRVLCKLFQMKRR